MTKEARFSLYLEDEEFKQEVKVAAARRGLPVTEYCAEAIEERLIKDEEKSGTTSRAKDDYTRSNGRTQGGDWAYRFADLGYHQLTVLLSSYEGRECLALH